MDITINLASNSASTQISGLALCLLNAQQAVLAHAICDDTGTLSFTGVNTDGTDLTLKIDEAYYTALASTLAKQAENPPAAPAAPTAGVVVGGGNYGQPLPYSPNWTQGNSVQYRYTYCSAFAESDSSPVVTLQVTDDTSQDFYGACPTLTLSPYTGQDIGGQAVYIKLYRMFIVNGGPLQPEMLLALLPAAADGNNPLDYTDSLA